MSNVNEMTSVNVNEPSLADEVFKMFRLLSEYERMVYKMNGITVKLVGSKHPVADFTPYGFNDEIPIVDNIKEFNRNFNRILENQCADINELDSTLLLSNGDLKQEPNPKENADGYSKTIL